MAVSNGMFSGTGVASSKVTVYGGVHAQGAPLGMQRIQGNYSLAAAATLRVAIHGIAPGATSVLSVRTGPVSLAGTLQVNSLPSLPTNSSFIIIEIDASDTITGSFVGLAEGATLFAGGFTWKVSYRGGDCNDVMLTIVGRANPSVSFSQSGGWLALNWPKWAGAYQLSAATNLLPHVTWFPLATPVSLSNGAFYAVIPCDCPLSFFRLQYP